MAFINKAVQGFTKPPKQKLKHYTFYLVNGSIIKSRGFSFEQAMLLASIKNEHIPYISFFQEKPYINIPYEFNGERWVILDNEKVSKEEIS